MTKWADPVSNPKQNAQYWRERRNGEVIFAIVIIASFAGAMGYICWQTHVTVERIVGRSPPSSP